MQIKAPFHRYRFLSLALFLVILLAGLGGTSFQHKVDAFQPLGFEVVAQAGACRVIGASGPATGLVVGDDILMVQGRQFTDPAELRELLVSRPESEVLVLRGGKLLEVGYERPPLAIQFPYLILAAAGLLYLLIGLYTTLKDGRSAARLFFFWCFTSAALYILSPVAAPQGLAERGVFLVDQLARTLLPALTLHLFLVFPTRLLRASALRFALPGVYLPAAVLLGYHVDQVFGGRAVFGSSERLLTWVDRLELLLIVGFSFLAVLLLVVRLAARPEWEERRQIQWITIGLVGGYVPFFALYVVPFSLHLAWPEWTTLVGVTPLVLVPLGFSYAILRYKLWDIGVILRDTISYSLTVFVGIFGFLLIHAGIQRGLGEEMAMARSFLTFAAGIFIAAVLVPTRGAISAGLERWQYRSSLSQRRALSKLGGDLLQERDLGRLCTTLLDHLEEGLAAHANLYLVESISVLAPVRGVPELPAHLGLNDLGEDLWHRDVRGLSGVELPAEEPSAETRLFGAGYRYAFPLRVREHRVGILFVGYRYDHEPLTSEDLELTRGLLNQAALALENAQLLAEVHRRLREVERLEEHNRGIIEASPAGIAVVDSRDRVVMANLAFATLVGRPESELKGTRLADLLAVRPLPEPEDGLLEVSYSELSGREHHLQISTADYEKGPGEEELKILVVQDTSARVEMETQLKEKERLASLGLIAAGVAHEVNTPLTGISSYAQMLLAGVPEESPQYEILKKIERQTFRAAQIVSNLLEFSRNRHDELVPVNLAAVLDESVRLLDERFAEAGVEVDYSSSAAREAVGTVPRVLGHEGELHQVFTNLLVNAVDAMAAKGEGGLIQVGLKRRGERLEASISDTGPGVPAERLERIFQPFFSSKLGKGGTGLGLAITHNIVRRHRGEIRVTNHGDGPGCTFTVELPLHRRD